MVKIVHKTNIGVSYAEDNQFPEYSDITINVGRRLVILSAHYGEGRPILGNELLELKRKYEEEIKNGKV